MKFSQLKTGDVFLFADTVSQFDPFPSTFRFGSRGDEGFAHTRKCHTDGSGWFDLPVVKLQHSVHDNRPVKVLLNTHPKQGNQ